MARSKRPAPMYLVDVKHGETFAHAGIVSTLVDVLDSYTSARTRVVVTDVVTGESRRIIGPVVD